jgi:hypothetical protein
MSFFWYQDTGGEDAWHEALSTHRDQIIRERQPAFVTVLDADSVPREDWGRDDYAKMRYSGPIYFDWDAEDVTDAITNFNLFLDKLQDMGVNLNSLRLYATGGRGFHLEVPMATFIPKIPKGGMTGLPYIYREMAMELVVDTLDMRVYTGRRGRMWRTPNVVRTNGRFKVPILVADARAMTPERYEELTSVQTSEPVRELPTLNMAMAAMFIKAQGRVDEAIKRRSKGTADEALLARFKGQFPPTLQKIMKGESLAPNVGFHKVAMQLAITANALGKSADDLVTQCQELCANYSGDSSRYGSPRKRKEELRRMWEYTHDNPCYSFSKGAIRSLLDIDAPTGDLDGVAAYAGVGHVPEGDEDEELPADVEAEITAAAASLMEGLMITKSGIHKRTADGAKTLSNIAFVKPTQLMDSDDHTVLGLEVDIFCDSQLVGRRTVPGKSFTSRSNLSALCADYGGTFSGSDTQAGVVQLMLSRAAKKGDRVVYALHREGLDVVQNPLIRDRSVTDVVWVSPDNVITENQEARYTFQPVVSTAPVFNADVHNAHVIADTEDTRTWLRALFDINSPTIVAQTLGWFVSCFHRQFYNKAFKQFPLLHPNGPAGCGKTLTTTLLAQMFYLKNPVVVKSCAPAASTAFSLKAAFTGSASIPLVLDEYKPIEMGTVRTDLLLQAFRLAYNQGTGSSGGMSKGNANASFRDITDYMYSTPIAFLAESQEMQTAIVQRCVPVGFNPTDSLAHSPAFHLASSKPEFMSQLGRALLARSFRETEESRREALVPIVKSLRENFDRSVHDRQVYNMAIVMEGLNFLDSVLLMVFKDGEMTGRIEALRAALYEHREEVSVAAMSEAAKMFSDLSLISRSEDSESEFALRESQEYIIGDGYIDLLMRETFVKYFSWCKRKGFTPYYASAESFMAAMGKFPPVMDKVCLSSPLRTSGQARVFRFQLDKLAQEGVEMFQTRSGK